MKKNNTYANLKKNSFFDSSNNLNSSNISSQSRNAIFKNKVIGNKTKETYSNKFVNSNKIPIFILRIETTKGIIRILKIYEDDDPVIVANNFGSQYNCNPNKIKDIIKQIKEYKKDYNDKLNNKTAEPEVKKNNNFLEKYSANKVQIKKNNIGEKLYYKGIKEKEKSLKKSVTKYANNSSKNLTFKPTLTPSKLFPTKTERGQLPIENHLLSYENKKKEHLEKLKSEAENKFNKDHSFKPKTNEISNQIILNKSSMSGAFVPKYEELYNKKEEKVKKIEDLADSYYSNICTFSPQINYSEITENFDSRNKKYVNKKNERLHNLIINETPNFHPEISSSNNAILENKRISQKENIHHYLYSLNNLLQKKLENEIEQKKEDKETLTQIKKVSKNSEKIIKEKLNEKIEEMFNYIDTDGDGKISKKDLKQENFDPEILDLFSVLFDEIINRNLVLNLNEFKESTNNLFDSYNFCVKNNILLNFGRERSKKPYQEKEYHYLPNYSKNKNKKLKDNNLFLKLYVKKGKRDEFVKEKKKEIAKNEMAECTFRPQINRYIRQ